MYAFTRMKHRAVRKRALALMFVLVVALAGVAALAASVPANAIPITGKATFVCVKGDEQVFVIAGRSAAQVFRQEGYTCTPDRVFSR
jgi:conjugal transfer/entry exclusion protein